MIQSEIKQLVSQRTGIPENLLNGDTPEEVITRARAVLAYKKSVEAERPKDAREQFIDWCHATEKENGYFNAADDYIGGANRALDEISETLRVEAGGYPRIADGGEIAHGGFTPPPEEQFRDWLYAQTAFDPTRTVGELWHKTL